MFPATDETDLMRRLFLALGRTLVGRPRGVLLLYLALLAVAAVTTVTRWQLKTDQNDLVGGDLEYNQRYLQFLEEFGDLEFIYAVVDIAGQPERAVRVADAIAEEVRELDEHVEWVFHHIDPRELRWGLLYQSPQALAQLKETLLGAREDVLRLAVADDLTSFYSAWAESLSGDRLMAAGAEDGSHSVAEAGLRLLAHTLDANEAALEGRTGVGLVERLERSAAGPLRDRGYLTTGQDGKETYLLVEILPSKDTSTVELIREPLAAIRAALDRVRSRFPGVVLGLTGRPVLQADEMTTTDSDMRRATLAALAGVFVLFVIFFRRLARPLIAILCLGAALLLTFGVTMLTIGYLTLLSIVFAAMLVGLGIDFGIHFVARYQEELDSGVGDDEGGCVESAIVRTLGSAGVSIGTGAVTTAAAFFMTLFVDFEGLRELGLIAGIGVLICFLAMVTLLPAGLVLYDRRRGARAGAGARPLRIPLLERIARRPMPVIVLFALLTLVGLVGFRGVPYNANLIELQAEELESVQWELQLIEHSDFSTWYAAFICPDIATVRQRVRQLEALEASGIVGKSESVLDWLPSEQEAKIATLSELGQGLGLASLDFAEPIETVDVEALAAALEELGMALDELGSALVQRGDDESVEGARELLDLVDRTLSLGEAIAEDPADAVAQLAPFQIAWFSELGQLKSSLRDALRPEGLEARDLPSVLARRFLSKDAERSVVYAYAQEDIWEEQAMQRFIDSMRAIDADVTGAPVQVYESAWRMREGFLLATLYSIIVVALLLWLDLRSVVHTLLAMVPILVGLFWLLELLPLFGLSFNLANFFALPILIGCGIDGGVHMVHRFRESGSAAEVSRTTATAVTLSYLTTLIGFGAMATASHRGVASLGLVMAIGLGAVLAATVLLLPALLELLERRRTSSRKPSGDGTR